MMWGSSDELSLEGQPVKAWSPLIIGFHHDDSCRSMPSNFDQVRSSGISPKMASLANHQAVVLAPVLPQHGSSKFSVSLGLGDCLFGNGTLLQAFFKALLPLELCRAK